MGARGSVSTRIVPAEVPISTRTAASVAAVWARAGAGPNAARARTQESRNRRCIALSVPSAPFVATLGPVFEALVLNQPPAVGLQPLADHVVEIAMSKDQHVLAAFRPGDQ